MSSGPATEPLEIPQGRPRGKDMFRALSGRGYRYFAGAQMASMIGLWVQRVVQDWTVLQFTGSAALVGLLILMQFGPNLLLGMWGGLIVDRGNTRRLLMFAQAGATIVSVVLCIFAFSGALSTELIFISVLAMGLLSVIEMPARQVFVNELVAGSALPNAISMNSTIFQTGTMLGPAIGGLLIPVGISWAFLVSAVLQCLSVVLLLGIRETLRPRTPAPRGKGQIIEALRYCLKKPAIFWTLFLLLFVSLIGLNWPVLLTSMADRVFESGGTGYGLYTSAVGVGALLGAVLSLQRRQVRLSSVYLSTIAFMVFKLVSGLVESQAVFVVLIALAGTCSVLMWTAANTTLQSSSNPMIRGRVMSLYLLIAAGGQALGGPTLGVIIEQLSPRWGMVLSGGVPLVAALVTGAVLLARYRRSQSN